MNRFHLHRCGQWGLALPKGEVTRLTRWNVLTRIKVYYRTMISRALCDGRRAGAGVLTLGLVLEGACVMNVAALFGATWHGSCCASARRLQLPSGGISVPPYLGDIALPVSSDAARYISRLPSTAYRMGAKSEANLRILRRRPPQIQSKTGNHAFLWQLTLLYASADPLDRTECFVCA